MFYGAKNGAIPVERTEMDYIRFGRGAKTLLMLPGVGDGFRTVKCAAAALALAYRKLAPDFTVYAVSRRNLLPAHFTTRQMAADLVRALDRLGIDSACVLGVSQGGMIAQHLALDAPDRVEKLVLCVTSSRPNRTLLAVVHNWMDMARAGDYKGVLLDTARKSYSEAYLKKVLPLYSLLGAVGKPKSFERFLTMAEACVTHNAYEALPQIKRPALIIGGMEDQIVTAAASGEIAGQIPGSSIRMYPGLGHGVYEEAGDFLECVRAFLLR